MKKVPMDHQHLTAQYIQDYLFVLNEKLTRYETELRQHLYAYPFISITSETIDVRLGEFVRPHHLDLIRLTNYKVNRFKDQLQEKRLSQQLVTCHLTLEHVRL
jgi:hypothetical protein